MRSSSQAAGSTSTMLGLGRRWKFLLMDIAIVIVARALLWRSNLAQLISEHCNPATGRCRAKGATFGGFRLRAGPSFNSLMVTGLARVTFRSSLFRADTHTHRAGERASSSDPAGRRFHQSAGCKMSPRPLKWPPMCACVCLAPTRAHTYTPEPKINELPLFS